MRLPAVRIAPIIATSLLVVSSAAACAQNPEPLTRPYSTEDCPPCAEWNAPHTPFRIHGNTWWVGTEGLGALLITSPEGLVLIDGGLPDSAPLILDNIRTLGFEPGDVRLILNSHAHYDHAGGIAALVQATGARVAATEQSARVLERGATLPNDPQHAVHLDFPAVASVERFADGDTLRVGPIALVAHLTAGHTPGGTSWSWRSCDDAGCLDSVYADSQTPISADGFHYSDSDAYPTALADFERAFRTLETLPCDILITPHPGASSLWERVEGGAGLVEAEGCRRYAAAGRRQLERRLEAEGAARQAETGSR